MDARARRILEETPWGRLEDAYGAAEDAPTHLAALIDPDPQRRFEGLDYLHGSILHQGTAYSATPATALFVIALLSGSDVPTELRPQLVEFLAHVASPTASALWDRPRQERLAAFDPQAFFALAEDEEKRAEFLAPYAEIFHDLGERSDLPPGLFSIENLPFFIHGQANNARGALACLPIAPDLAAFFLGALDDADARSRLFAAIGAVRLADADRSGAQRETLAPRLRDLAWTAETSDERAAYVMALGDLGDDTRPFLDDPAPGVRLCAALARGLAADPAALALLRRALEEDATRMESWFGKRPPQFWGRPRINVVQRLVQSAESFDEVADAAVALAGVPGLGAEPSGIDDDLGQAVTLTEAMAMLSARYPGGGITQEEWGSLLALAFPDGDGIVRTQAQRRYLRALVARDDIWNPEDGNALGWFDKAGLPHDREACAALARVGS